MLKLVTMREALASPEYFGTYIAGPSWDAWRVLLTAIMGEPLTDAERVTFKVLTGREREPTEPVREFWGIIGRRGGKSRATAVLAAYLAACVDHRAVLAPGEVGVLPILAASRGQAGQLFNFVAGIFETVPAFAGMVTDATADTLRLMTGVHVIVTSASWRTVRSITAVSAIGDEVAFWRSDDSANPDAEIIAALKPALLTTGGMFVGISSPYSQKGEVYKAFQRHHGPGGDPRKLVAKAATLAMNPGLPAEGRAEIEKAFVDDPSAAAAEYGGEFRTDVETFITPEAVTRATEEKCTERAYQRGTQYLGFVDPSGGAKDSMTLAIAHRAGTVMVLDLIREERPPFSPEAVTERFAAELKRFGITRVVGDRYAGEWVREPFRRHGITYDLSDMNKSEIYQAVLPLINSKQALLLDNTRLANQLVGLERRTGRGGRDSIDHAPGGHDDIANAVSGVLTLMAATKPRMSDDEYKAFRRKVANAMAR